MKQGLSLRVSQHLALTPQLQQSIRLLQLSTLEMSQEVEQMLDDNPFLERDQDQAEREQFGLDSVDAPVSEGDRISEQEASFQPVPASGTTEAEAPATPTDGDGGEISATEPDWGGDGSVELSPDDGEWGGEALPRNGARDDEEVSAADLATPHRSLQDHLHEQVLGLRLNDDERGALIFLIESLNEDGYLDEALQDLALALWTVRARLEPTEVAAHNGARLIEVEQLERLLERALRWLQAMEPTGVGARSLPECLQLQVLELRNTPEAQAALKLLECPLDMLARRDVRRLCQHTAQGDEVVRGALGLIARLEPKPGRRFVDLSRQIVVPDVLVTRVERGFKVQLNPDVMPRLRVHDVYASALRQNRGEGSQALQQRLQEARWFIKNIQQRFDTILRVASAIVERQRNFFIHGELAMRPLVLREIADELGLHESTISRVTTAKYMATPFGTFELKYFFGSSLGTETGGNASSTAVRALIKQFVAAEDQSRPLSDSQLSEMLREQGIECARRTVAKYREALRIAPANLRKAL